MSVEKPKNPPKKPYTKPNVKRLGSVRELTATNTTGSVTDNFGARKKTM